MPYRGINEEIVEGKKTKISLFNDRMEYNVYYKQSVKIQSTSDEDNVQEVIQENNEEGFMLRNDILGVVKYIKTEYREDLSPFKIHYVDICGNGTSITLSLEKEEDKENLYKELKEWRLNASK